MPNTICPYMDLYQRQKQEIRMFPGVKTEYTNRRLLLDRLRALKIHKSAKLRLFNNKKNRKFKIYIKISEAKF